MKLCRYKNSRKEIEEINHQLVTRTDYESEVFENSEEDLSIISFGYWVVITMWEMKKILQD
jgi:hypothetical protein